MPMIDEGPGIYGLSLDEILTEVIQRCDKSNGLDFVADFTLESVIGYLKSEVSRRKGS